MLPQGEADLSADRHWRPPCCHNGCARAADTLLWGIVSAVVRAAERFKAHSRRGWPPRGRMGRSDAGAHAPLVEGGLILLLVHGVVDVLIIVPACGPRRRRLRLVQDARDVLHALRQSKR